MMYLSLGELLELIRNKENWDRVFRATFPVGKASFEDAARRLAALRNRVAHSRPLSAEALLDLGARPSTGSASTTNGFKPLTIHALVQALRRAGRS